MMIMIKGIIWTIRITTNKYNTIDFLSEIIENIFKLFYYYYF
jgi:hypothetical protein